MSIWNMSGPELSRELSQPAPVTVLRGGHNGGVSGILSQIAALPPAERDSLLRAFQAALKPEVKRIGGGQSYRTAEAFFADFNAAREACRKVHGESWYLSPRASLKARVPGVWTALKGEQGIWRSPRDVNCPRAEFWPGGVLPTGPEYAERGPLAPKVNRRVDSMRANFPTMAKHVFALEPTPENIEAAEAA